MIIHRWAGLTIALALVATALTGAILPYQRELSDWLAPAIWVVEPAAQSAVPLSGIQLASRVEAATGGVVSYIPLSPDRERAQAIFVSPRDGGPALGYDEVFVEPYSGTIRAKVRYADLSAGPVNLIPFLMSFHYSLAAGEWGRFVLGVAALLWFGMSLIGIALSLPKPKAGWRRMPARWLRAWTVRRGRGNAILTHDFHRASGLWIWPITLVFAWSAVAFNLEQVHRPVQRFLGAKGLYRPVVNPAPVAGETMSRDKAASHGARLMADEAARAGFVVREPVALSLAPQARAMGFYARTSLDDPSKHGATVVWFDQVSGKQISFHKPYGSTAADAVDKFVRILHTADGLGWPYRLFVSLFALLTAATAFAGVLMWFRRSGRVNGGGGARC